MNSLVEGQPALVSIHDVMPETLSAVQRCLDACHEQDLYKVYLLVVPGRQWQPAQLQTLRRWLADGCEVVGHGWLHHCPRISSPYHRLHSALISRNVAEHLTLDGDGILQLMQRCHAWFGEHELPTPSLYVPPAWALGRIDDRALAQSGFDHVETIKGIRDVHTGQWRLGLLLGYEADDALRQRVLGVWNRATRRLAAAGQPLRIGIHPHDPDLRLADELLDDLSRCRAVSLSSVFRERVVPVGI